MFFDILGFEILGSNYFIQRIYNLICLLNASILLELGSLDALVYYGLIINKSDYLLLS